MDLKQLSKHDVRYWLFRFKTEELGGNKATGSPSGLKKHFEQNEDFIGWEMFNESKGWDVKDDNFLEMRTLKFGSDELWNRHLKKTLKPLPDKEELKVLKKKKK